MLNPPIGLMPRWRWEEACREKRVEEIRWAMDRYHRAEIPIPPAWHMELLDIASQARTARIQMEVERNMDPLVAESLESVVIDVLAEFLPRKPIEPES